MAAYSITITESLRPATDRSGLRPLEVPRRRLFYALAAIPFCDCIIDQVNNAFSVMIGPLSLLQVVHGGLMLVYAWLSVSCLIEDRARFYRLPVAALGSFVLIGIALSKELIVHGSLRMASIGAYGQMGYWVLFWITLSLLGDLPEQAEILLRGIGVGAMGTAVSVFLGFFFGAPNYYETDGVASSAGWFATAKMVTGVLVTGGTVLLYLGRHKKSWLYPLCACTCFFASILTYARAGQVALAAAVLWLAIWQLVFGRGGRERWLTRFLIIVVLAAAVVPPMLGADRLFARWGDVKQGAEAGSGRAAFWKIAYDNYLSATPAEQALGRGYAAMSDMLLRDYGMDIKHTHNDMLDMLTVGGIAGGSWLLVFIGSWAVRVVRFPIASVEGGAGGAILLTYLLHGQFTGQLWGTDAMSYYTLSLTAIGVIAAAQRRSPRA